MPNQIQITLDTEPTWDVRLFEGKILYSAAITEDQAKDAISRVLKTMERDRDAHPDYLHAPLLSFAIEPSGHVRPIPINLLPPKDPRVLEDVTS